MAFCPLTVMRGTEVSFDFALPQEANQAFGHRSWLSGCWSLANQNRIENCKLL